MQERLNQQRLKQMGLTPAKGAAIVGLLLLLAVVWGPQIISFGGKTGKGNKVAKKSVPSSHAAGSSTLKLSSRKNLRRSTGTRSKQKRSSPGVTKKSSSAKRETPLITASEAGAYDPFRVPDWSPFAARLVRSSSGSESASSLTEGELEERAAVLRQAGVAMILVSSTGQIAKIGDQTVQVGDEIDGFRVIQITAEGVVLKPNGSKNNDHRSNEGDQ